MKWKILIFGLLPLLALSVQAGAEELNAEKIVNKANLAAYYAGDDGRAEVTMTITDSQGRERLRRFILLRKNKKVGGEQLFYVYFKKPSDVRKMVFMVHKHLDRDDDRWLYLPALDLVKRIAAADKRTSFVGSNYLYEDVSGRGVNADTHELVATDDEYYVVKNIPKNPGEVEFSSYTVWIDKNTFIPMKTEYLDKNNIKYRIVEALEVREIDGHPTVTVSKATDLDSGSSTLSKFTSIKYDIGLKDNIFTERYLRRPPREVRK
ncbi:MAG: outer membrane lipoprotein-sorting protein [Desulfobulbaceae bacterium]|nr:outer membrane lipoprotein-sorting protein [Desulfobulbaceae bacterium]